MTVSTVAPDVRFTTTLSPPVALAIAARPERTSITLSEA